MTILWSKTTGGFYDTQLNYASLPDDVVEVSEAQREELLAANSQGYQITSDARGYPQATKRSE